MVSKFIKGLRVRVSERVEESHTARHCKGLEGTLFAQGTYTDWAFVQLDQEHPEAYVAEDRTLLQKAGAGPGRRYIAAYLLVLDSVDDDDNRVVTT